MTKPKTKYFFFKTYSNSSEEALKAAIQYRDNQLNEWLAHSQLLLNHVGDGSLIKPPRRLSDSHCRNIGYISIKK